MHEAIPSRIDLSIDCTTEYNERNILENIWLVKNNMSNVYNSIQQFFDLSKFDGMYTRCKFDFSIEYIFSIEFRDGSE